MSAFTDPQQMRDVFSYSKKYYGKVFTIYINDKILFSESLHLLIKDIVHILDVGIKVILVCGAHKTINTVFAQHTNNIESEDTRIISENKISLVQMAAFNAASRLITEFARYRQTAVLGNWTLARSHGVVDGVDYKHAGVIEKIDSSAIHKILQDNVIPIFPTIGWSYTGTPYYLNPIDIAARVSIDMQASKLFFMLEDTPESYLEKFSKDALKDVYFEDDAPLDSIRRINLSQARSLLKHNEGYKKTQFFHAISKGVLALSKGVERIHMLDGTQDGSLIIETFLNEGSGFMIYADDYESIIPMQEEDAADVLGIMKPFIESGTLKKRTMEMLIQQHQDFVIYKTDDHIKGVAALHSMTKEYGEIAGLAVSSEEGGTGRKLMQFLLLKAKKLNYKKVFVFTLQTGDWFERLGFYQVNPQSSLPKERFQQYKDSKRESRVYCIDLDSLHKKL